MKNNNNLVAIQAFILLCAFALPFISLYCSEKPPRRLSRITRSEFRKRKQLEKTNQETRASQPEISEMEKSTQETPSTEISEEAPTTEPQIPSSTPRSWSWYDTIAPLLLVSAYKGAETGIGEFAKTIIMLFTAKRDREQLEQQLEPIKEKLYLFNADYQKYASTEEKLAQFETLPTQKQKELLKEFQQIPNLNAIVSKAEQKLMLQEKQTSIPAIIATSTYMGLLNTAVLIMGTLMGSAVKLGIQMLMPAQQP